MANRTKVSSTERAIFAMLDPKALKQIPYFSELGQESSILKELTMVAVEKKYENGQIIFLEGEKNEGLYYLVEGRIRIFKSGPGGREQILQLVGAGQLFNEVALLEGTPLPASAEALERSLIWIIPVSTILAVIEHEPAVARIIINDLARRVHQLTTLVADISLKQVTARVAKIILDQAEQGVILGVGISNQLTNQLTQQQMASMVGTVREMIGRALRTLQKAGAIEAKRGHIIIINVDKLRGFL